MHAERLDRTAVTRDARPGIARCRTRNRNPEPNRAGTASPPPRTVNLRSRPSREAAGRSLDAGGPKVAKQPPVEAAALVDPGPQPVAPTETGNPPA